jgi:DNA-binding PadR family transcriptional regulator
VLQVEEGSLYPALQRMLIKGWVEAQWDQTDTNRRARFYRLTPAGRKRLHADISEFTRVVDAITRDPAGGGLDAVTLAKARGPGSPQPSGAGA